MSRFSIRSVQGHGSHILSGEEYYLLTLLKSHIVPHGKFAGNFYRINLGLNQKWRLPPYCIFKRRLALCCLLVIFVQYMQELHGFDYNCAALLTLFLIKTLPHSDHVKEFTVIHHFDHISHVNFQVAIYHGLIISLTTIGFSFIVR